MGLAFALLIWLVAAVAAFRIAGRMRLWRAGRPAAVDWRAGLAAVPRRYLKDVHHVVARDAFTARMHMLAAGGLLAGAGLAALALCPLLAGSSLWWLLDAAAFALAIAGARMAAMRRAPRPARLSGGSFQRLPGWLAAFTVGGFLTALLLAFHAGAITLVALALTAWGGLRLALSVASGPMRHPVAGALHLAAHPRPERFSQGPSTPAAVALMPSDIDAPSPGVEKPVDFAWNRLLSFDACVQCGRCEAACPAFASGQPLNPKRLIQDLSLAMAPGASNAAYYGSPYPHARDVAGIGGPDRPIIGADAMIHPDTLWACTTCRACVEECPMMIEHVDAVIDLRRHQTLALGAVPEKAAVPLDEMRLADEPGGRALSARGDFAAGLPLPLVPEGGETDVLLWLGESAYDLRAGRTLRAMLALLTKAGVRYGTLGADERDCGDLARRLGDEATFRRLALENIAALEKRRFRLILTADPHAMNALRNDYRALGGHFTVVHHTAYLETLVSQGRLSPVRLEGQSVTYHDPCYLGRWNGETEAPRTLLSRLGLDLREMERHGRRSQCCGGGGGAPVSDIAGERRIPDIRMDQARTTGAAIVVVACPGCTAMLEGVPAPRPEVLDVAELLLKAVEQAA